METKQEIVIKRKILWLRIAFYLGAFADGLMVIEVLVSDESSKFIAATLMAGWTLLLIWASIKPVERKDVITLTIFVIIGLIYGGIYYYLQGGKTIEQMIPIWIMQSILLVLYVFNFFNSKRLVE